MTPAELATLLAAAGGFLVALAGAFVSVWNAVHISKVHTIVNSQATKMEAMSQRVGFAEGRESVGKPPTEM